MYNYKKGKNNMNKLRETGFFITLEGGEGAGKTTVAKAIEKYINSQGLKCIYTREPGGGQIAEQIRNTILDKSNISMDPITEAMLYAAARRQHIVEVVEPALSSGCIVLCDRFIDSSIAYQGVARGLGSDKILEINKPAIGNCWPNLTILLDVDPEVGLKRIFDNNRDTNRLDLESIDFHKKVRKGYLDNLDNKRTILIDASGDTEETLGIVVAAISKTLQKENLL